MQQISSADTSLNQVPTLIRRVELNEDLSKGKVLLDYGAGKYDKTQKYVEGTHEVSYYAYDPYNRSKEENKAALAQKADIVMLSNVLNVIREPEARLQVLKNVRRQMKPGARLYIRTYQAPKSSLYQEDPYPGQPTHNGTCWQNCQPLSFYVEEIKKVLPDIEVRPGYLIAKC